MSGATTALGQETEENNGQVQAPGESDQLDQAARLTFEAGRDAFANGNYEDALERFEQAYRLSPRPILLYNVGLALDRLRRDEEALAKFREYLAITLEQAPERTQVEARVRSLEQAVAREQALRDALEQSERNAEDQEAADVVDRGVSDDSGSGGMSPLWVVIAGSAALVAAGVTVWSGLDASSKNDDFEAFATSPGATFAGAQTLYDDTVAAEGRTNVLIGVTAGLAVTAGVLAIFTDWDGDDESMPTPSVALGPDSVVVGTTGAF